MLLFSAIWSSFWMSSRNDSSVSPGLTVDGADGDDDVGKASIRRGNDREECLNPRRRSANTGIGWSCSTRTTTSSVSKYDWYRLVYLPRPSLSVHLPSNFVIVMMQSFLCTDLCRVWYGTVQYSTLLYHFDDDGFVCMGSARS